MKITAVLFTLFFTASVSAQFIKNADFSEKTVVETLTVKDGRTLNYVSENGKTIRALAGKETPYYQQLSDKVLTAVNNGWINSPNWKRKSEWALQSEFSNGAYRSKAMDEENAASYFEFSNFFQPAKGHPLYQYFLNKNDSLYQPSAGERNSKAYLTKVQNYENNSPRIGVKVYINSLIKDKSISEFAEYNLPLRIKTPYKAYQRNDSVWFKNADMFDMNESDMNFQKNKVYVVLGNIKCVDFSKGISEGIQEYRLTTYPNKEKTDWMRLDHLIIELTGHPESIKLFLDKIDWKALDAAFKFKIK
jgi:hypothetical protein